MSSYQIQRRTYRSVSASLTDLPFVSDIKTGKRGKRRSFWHVPPADDQFRASDLGMQYACDYLQYLKDNPCVVGMPVLIKFIEDMAALIQTPERSYAISFMSFLEELLHDAVLCTDHHAQAQQYIDECEQVRRELKGNEQ